MVRRMAETQYEAIKNFSEDEMALFLMHMVVGTGIPLRHDCGVVNCFCCNDNLACFKEWLNKEVLINAAK